MIIIIDLLDKETILVEDIIAPKEEPSEPKKPEGFVDLELEIVNWKE